MPVQGYLCILRAIFKYPFMTDIIEFPKNCVMTKRENTCVYSLNSPKPMNTHIHRGTDMHIYTLITHTPLHCKFRFKKAAMDTHNSRPWTPLVYLTSGPDLLLTFPSFIWEHYFQ